MNILVKFLFLVLNAFCPSSIVRAKIMQAFGARVGKGVKIEKILLMHFEGWNMKNLVLGDKVFIGPGTILDLKDEIIIGESVKIAPGCNISTHVDCGKENIISSTYPARHEKVVIGKGSWVGVSSTILCGVTIGENVVVGAASLVRNDIPSNSVAYGVPAKVHTKS